MKKVILYILTAAAIFVFLTESIMAQEKRTFNYGNFKEVNVGWGMHVRIAQASKYSIEVTAEKEDMKVLKVEQRGDALRFYIDKDWYRKKGDIYIDINMPLLTALGLSGGSEGRISMNTASRDFTADLSGASNLKGELSCGDAQFSLSGGSTIDLSGKAADINLDGSGGSIFKLKNFNVHNTDADLSGGCIVKITLNGTLNSSQSGGSQIIYYGNARLGNNDFSGGSGVSSGD